MVAKWLLSESGLPTSPTLTTSSTYVVYSEGRDRIAVMCARILKIFVETTIFEAKISSGIALMRRLPLWICVLFIVLNVVNGFVPRAFSTWNRGATQLRAAQLLPDPLPYAIGTTLCAYRLLIFTQSLTHSIIHSLINIHSLTHTKLYR